MNEEKNEFVDELKKCVKKQVEVVMKTGEKFVGQCRAISYNHLNVVLMTETEKIILKDISHIKRKRSLIKNVK